MNAPVYAEFHRWLGRTDVLQPMWDVWKAGDRKQALDEIPDSLVDELSARLADLPSAAPRSSATSTTA